MDARSLSSRESQVILGLRSAGQETVTVKEISKVAGVSPSYAGKLAHTLSRKLWLQRIGRGRYLINPPENGPERVPDTNAFRVGSHLIEPYYFGFSTAATFHGLLTQVPQTFHLATPRKAERSLDEPVSFRLVHVSPRKFFGRQRRTKFGSEFWLSNLEKTVLDSVDRPDLLGGHGHVARVVYAAKPHLDYSRLLRYVRRTRNQSLSQRVGYLLTHLRPEVPLPRAFQSALRREVGINWVHLGSVSEFGSKGHRDAIWRIVVNVPEEWLLGEVLIR